MSGLALFSSRLEKAILVEIPLINGNVIEDPVTRISSESVGRFSSASGYLVGDILVDVTIFFQNIIRRETKLIL
jgi:hypothetical protein